jgi:hypothetical protein
VRTLLIVLSASLLGWQQLLAGMATSLKRDHNGTIFRPYGVHYFCFSKFSGVDDADLQRRGKRGEMGGLRHRGVLCVAV